MTEPRPADRTPLEGALNALLGEFALDALYVFGSRASEVAAAVRLGRPLLASNPSDIDIGALPHPSTALDAQSRARLVMALESLLSGARIDLILLPEAPPFLALDIVNGELVAVGDRDRTAEYELFVLRRAGDLAPFERERRRLALDRGRRPDGSNGALPQNA